jgi:hypothetical protein
VGKVRFHNNRLLSRLSNQDTAAQDQHREGQSEESSIAGEHY